MTDKKNNKRRIQVRMYRVGFGDCFLLTLPYINGKKEDERIDILIDCGVHTRSGKSAIEQVVNDIAKITEKN